jgi:hypothetical protein
MDKVVSAYGRCLGEKSKMITVMCSIEVYAANDYGCDGTAKWAPNEFLPSIVIHHRTLLSLLLSCSFPFFQHHIRFS